MKYITHKMSDVMAVSRTGKPCFVRYGH